MLLPVYEHYPLEIESGEGCYLIDTSGKRYLDAITGIGVNALGHNHPAIMAVLLHQAQRSIHTSNLFRHPYQAPLAERLCAMSGLDRAFFSSTGTEAMETALKTVRAHGRKFNPRKTGLVALRNSFHGRTIGSLAVTGQPKYQCLFEPLTPQVTFVEPNDCEGLIHAVTEETAGIVLEPVLGEGGVIPLHESFLQLARSLATQSGALLVADEVQCGLGRTGCYFAYQWANIRPDLVVTAKPLAAGLPLSATLFTEAAAAVLPPGMHGTTFGGGPLACRVALKFLEILDELLPHIQETGEYLRKRLQGLRHAGIKEVRGKGLMIGVELSFPGRPVVEHALELGLVMNCTHDTVLRLLPPYILTRDQADHIVHILDEALYAQEDEGHSHTRVRRSGSPALRGRAQA